MTTPRSEELLAALVQCQAVFDETGSIDECIERYPQYAGEIVEYFAVVDWLRGFEVKSQSPRMQAFTRRAFLAAVSSQP